MDIQAAPSKTEMPANLAVVKVEGLPAASGQVPAVVVVQPVSPKHKGIISTTVADVISAVSSIAVGVITAWNGIEGRAYKNLSSQGMWNDLKPKRAEKGAEILQQALDGKITPAQAHNRIKEAIMHGEETADARMKALGSLKIWEQWDLLRNHQKREVIIATVAVGGIALGTTLLLARGLFSKQQQEELAQKPVKDSQPVAPDVQR